MLVLPGSVAPRQDDLMMTVYVLKLRHECWYVGLTGPGLLKHRWCNHVLGAGVGSEWTKRHPPLCIESVQHVLERDATGREVLVFAELVMRHGVNFVRTVLPG